MQAKTKDAFRKLLQKGLMCALQNVPMGDKACDVIEALQARHERLMQEARWSRVEERLNQLEKHTRSTVEGAAMSILEALEQPHLDGPALTQNIRTFRGIQASGWSPMLFSGLIHHSSHWSELWRNPQNYGRLLQSHHNLDPQAIHLLLPADHQGRILELSPFAFHALLAGQQSGIPPAQVTRGQRELWATPQVPNDPKLVSESVAWAKQNANAVPEHIPRTWLAQEQNPSKPPPSSSSKRWFDRGLEALKTNDTVSAEAAFRKAHGAASSQKHGILPLLFKVGAIEFDHQNWSKALHIFRILQRMPLDDVPKLKTEVLYRLGWVYTELGDTRRAKAMLQSALRFNGNKHLPSLKALERLKQRKH